jgi:hypothetical protein
VNRKGIQLLNRQHCLENKTKIMQQSLEIKWTSLGTTPCVDPIWQLVQQLIRAQGNLCCSLWAETPQTLHVAGMSCICTYLCLEMLQKMAWQRLFPHVELEEDGGGRRVQSVHNVCEEHNLECEVTMLKQWSVLDRFWLGAHSNSTPLTPPKKTSLCWGQSTRSCCNKSITRYLSVNQTRVL